MGTGAFIARAIVVVLVLGGFCSWAAGQEKESGDPFSEIAGGAGDFPDYACACGCGIFEVGTSTMLPRGEGGEVWFEYDFQDQNMNWSGSSRAPAGDNDDKEIRTSFMTLGFEYMFDREWGIEAEVPTAYRYFQGTGGASGEDIFSKDWAALGDIRVQGIYTGFSPDMSAGVTFGFKLPTGDFTVDSAEIDRDTQIGTGSIDGLVGGFYRDHFLGSGDWNWFVQGLVDVPLVGRDGYLPGTEVDAAVGIYYGGFHLGEVMISPVAQVLESFRAEDSGVNASFPTGSGYERIFLSPGVEVDFGSWMIYADGELPVYEHVNGDQVVAPVLVKFVVGYRF